MKKLSYRKRKYTFYNALIDDEDEPEDIMSINQSVPVLSCGYAEISDDVLRN